jgi:hypothetical protein
MKLNKYYYVVRHKISGEVMPQMRRNKGYTHWNPGTSSVPESALVVPRLLLSSKQAYRVIAQWACNPNMTVRYFEDGEDVKINPDGRKKGDLEVRKVKLTFPQSQVNNYSDWSR